MEIKVMRKTTLDSRAELDISTSMGIKQNRQVGRLVTFSRYGAIVPRPKTMSAKSASYQNLSGFVPKAVNDIMNFNVANDLTVPYYAYARAA